MVGRKEEIAVLNELYNSTNAELVAVYGRRRVGKTFLVDETFGEKITFRHAGLSPAGENGRGLLQEQLNSFYESLTMYGMEECEKPKSWFDAFLLLKKHLQNTDTGGRQLVFIDELPWLDTPRSGFIRAFESFWNNWGCHRRNLMVVVCGSANSWIQDKLINNRGGLYNRLTYQMKLTPFTLKECEEFFISKGFKYSRYTIVESYMVFGGIPYYLNYLDKRKSLAQNIDSLFFAKHAVFRDEFNRLFESIFTGAEGVKDIVRLLYKRNAGFTRKEIVQHLNISDGGKLSRDLNALITSDFVIKYVPFSLSKRAEHYKLTDPFCLFFLHFVDGQTKLHEKYWEQNAGTQMVVTWRGFAFENVCFNHVEQIKRGLGISGVVTSTSAWSKKKDDEEGLQIDLLILRNDNVINMCECKFYSDIFAVDEAYYRKILGKTEMLLEAVPRKTAVYSTLIATYGLKQNEYSSAFINVVTLEDLFN